MRLCRHNGGNKRRLVSIHANRHLSQSTSRLYSSTPKRHGLQVDPVCLDLKPQYQRAKKPNSEAKNIAILGGGITGLTAAFHISKEIPSARVQIFEKSKTLGGWLQSDLVEVDGGHVVFENGPRTLRNSLWGARYTKYLIAQLDLSRDLVHVSKNSAAARNRYIYYPDHLVRLPGRLPGASMLMNIVRNGLQVWQEPLFDKLIPGLSYNFSASRTFQRPKGMHDESVGDFVTRNFNQNIAENLVSALMHGVYAGDLNRLSARSLLPLFWELEVRNKGLGIMSNFLMLLMNGAALVDYNDVLLRTLSFDDVPREQRNQLERALSDTSVFTFKKGLGQLVESLSSHLKQLENIVISLSSQVDAIVFNSTEKSLMVEAGGVKSSIDYVISTLPPSALGNLLRFENQSHSDTSKNLGPFLDHDYAVNVIVVNLFYSQPELVPVPGFGYLIPKTVPLEQNPERALGVIFGSDSSGDQDTAPGTKLTVMLGGHWWDDWGMDDLPDESSAIGMAQAIVKRHLGISTKPTIAKSVLQRQAIPQYTVGHRARMQKIHNELLHRYQGRVKVAGNWYHGVGVNDCIKAARKCVSDIREGFDQRTGLETFGQDIDWAVWKPTEGTISLK